MGSPSRVGEKLFIGLIAPHVDLRFGRWLYGYRTRNIGEIGCCSIIHTWYLDLGTQHVQTELSTPIRGKKSRLIKRYQLQNPHTNETPDATYPIRYPVETKRQRASRCPCKFVQIQVHHFSTDGINNPPSIAFCTACASCSSFSLRSTSRSSSPSVSSLPKSHVSFIVRVRPRRSSAARI